MSPAEDPRYTLLVIDDDSEMLEAVDGALRDAGYATIAHASGEAALEALGREDVDVVVTDLKMPAIDGVSICARITGNHPTVPVVVMTAFGDVDAAAAAKRAGAVDFLTKPFSRDELLEAIGRALRWRGSLPATRRLSLQRTVEPARAPELIGSSSLMRQLLERVKQIAPADVSVLITGESGTGKELVARALHAFSHRGRGPFVAVNCAAIPRELMESELFGHMSGAFTGADRSRPGMFKSASGGTLFLDEIGSMPLELQPKLLRALQQRSVRPIGSADEEPFDCRVIAATNTDLWRAVAQGTFREDLLYRIDVANFVLPPLRDRGDDILELAEHFLRKHAPGERAWTMEGEARALLRGYLWPGNVRELENCIQAAIAYSSEGAIAAAALPERIRSEGKRHRTPAAGSLSLDAIEREHIEHVLRATGGNKAKAAETLGIDRTTLYRKLKRHGLESRWR